MLFIFNGYSPEQKGEEAAENAEVSEADVQGNVQIKMVVSNGKVSKLYSMIFK